MLGNARDHSVVDIAKPASGPGISQPGLYVAFSRSPGRENICILKDFGAEIERFISTHITESLRRDDKELDEQDAHTTSNFRNGTLFAVVAPAHF